MFLGFDTTLGSLHKNVKPAFLLYGATQLKKTEES
jgi:hypothetical protein